MGVRKQRNWNILGLALGLAVLSPGCETQESQDPGSLGLQERKSSKARVVAKAPSTEEQSTLKRGSFDLSFELLRRLNQNNANLAVSARSLRSAMGQVVPMAKGATQAGVLKGMHLPEDAGRALGELSYIEQELESRNIEKTELKDAVELHQASRLVVRKELTPGPAFLDTLATHFGTGVSMADFAKDSSSVLEEVNAWVEAQTKGRISDLLDQSTVNPSTQWLLVNALYFRAPWAGIMKAPKPLPFHTLDNRTIEVPTLPGSAHEARFGTTDQDIWGQIPLHGNKLSLMVIVPHQGKFESVRATLNAASVEQRIAAAKSGAMDIYLPKFKIETGRLPVDKALQAMGMTSPFEPNADFSGFTDGQGSADPLVSIVQKVFFAVSKDGIEAAAATAQSAGGSAMPDEPFQLKVDRPFLFALIDQPTGIALFAGQVTDPTQ